MTIGSSATAFASCFLLRARPAHGESYFFVLPFPTKGIIASEHMLQQGLL
jgi:hypothetical protein